MAVPNVAACWEASLILGLRNILRDERTVKLFRMRSVDWTRRRSLTVEVVVGVILQGHKFSFGNALNRAFGSLGQLDQVPTPSALCQARHKLKPEIFLHLTRAVVEHFYTLPRREITFGPGIQPMVQPGVRFAESATGSQNLCCLVWRGRRLVAVDGTKWNLPDTEANRLLFGTAKNQNNPEGRAQGQGLILYDLLNDLGLHAVLAKASHGKVSSEKAVLFDGFLEHTQHQDIVVLDRGFAAYSVIAFLTHHRRDCVIRLPRTTFKAAREFWESSNHDVFVEIGVTPDQKAFVLKHHLPLKVKLRLVKVTLPNGDIEVLATSLVDKARYPREDLAEVYHQRWQIEGYIHRLKNIFEIEPFNAQSEQHMLQDFYGVVFLSTLESTLTRNDRFILNEQSRKNHCKHQQQVNRSISYVALTDRVLQLLVVPSTPVEQVLAELHLLFRTSPTLVRPHRSFPRKKNPTASQPPPVSPSSLT